MALKRKTNLPFSYDYTPISERGEKEPFTVTLKKLSAKENASIEDKLVEFHQDESVTFSTASTNFLMLQMSMINWKNMLDENDKPIALKVTNGLVTEESLNLLPPELIVELAKVVVGISKDPENAEFYLGTAEPDATDK